MINPDNQFVVFEDHDLNVPIPKKLHLGRLVAESGRKAIAKYTLKKRPYIATTSMDAELALITANLALAAPGKLAYDPFMGTGSCPLACAHFGAAVFGSDLDGRSIRGKGGRSVKGNFAHYGTDAQYLGGFIADLTNSPLKCGAEGSSRGRWLDAILCDPPYGVREGLKVLGSTKVALQEVVLLADGTPAHLSGHYIPPKKPYSFTRMLDDILAFSASVLVDGGRLCMWMPVAGEPAEGEEQGEDYAIPRHPALGLVSECTQHFNKWSRRLLTYRRLRDEEVDREELLVYDASKLAMREEGNGKLNGTADDLNAFRRKVMSSIHLLRSITVADSLPVLPRLQNYHIRIVLELPNLHDQSRRIPPNRPARITVREVTSRRPFRPLQLCLRLRLELFARAVQVAQYACSQTQIRPAHDADVRSTAKRAGHHELRIC